MTKTDEDRNYKTPIYYGDNSDSIPAIDNLNGPAFNFNQTIKTFMRSSTFCYSLRIIQSSKTCCFWGNFSGSDCCFVYHVICGVCILTCTSWSANRSCTVAMQLRCEVWSEHHIMYCFCLRDKIIFRPMVFVSGLLWSMFHFYFNVYGVFQNTIF